LLQRLLHADSDVAMIIYYLATYHLTVQLLSLFTTIHMGECFRCFLTNGWRWIDVVAGILAIWCARAASSSDPSSRDDDDDDGTTLLPSNLGAAATAACWLSLLGYMADWWYGAAVFVGSATRLSSVLAWPLCVAAMGIVATSQVLYTLQDCPTTATGEVGMCTLSDAYAVVYGMMLGEPVPMITAGEDDGDVPNGGYSAAVVATVIVFTVLWIWWILSAACATLTEVHRLDRNQLALAWYWEPKIALAIMATGIGDHGKTKKRTKKISDAPSLMDRYCDGMERCWDILTSVLRDGEGRSSNSTINRHWNAWCFRSRLTVVITGCVSVVILPIWLAAGLLTMGLLWPPQVRRWLFRPAADATRSCGGGGARSTNDWGNNNKNRVVPRVPTPPGSSSPSLEEDVARAKLSQLRTDLIDLRVAAYDQNYHIQKDLGLIKEILFRAVMEEDEEEEEELGGMQSQS
jgi:hypothetical protein